MKKAMKQFMKRAAAFGLAAVMMGAMAGPAYATEVTAPGGLFPGTNPGTPEAPADAIPKITKRVRVPEGVLIPGNTYTFEFTQLPVEDKTTETSPAINNGTSDTTDDNKISITFTANTAPGTTPDIDKYMYLDLESDNILANTTFPHAGIYVYTVKEIPGSSVLDGGTMTYSQAEYKMRVYVDNVKDATTGDKTYVKYVTFHSVKDDKGTAAGDETDTTKIKPVFTNTYAKNTSFVISKTVLGAYADKTLDFTYKITLWNAPGATATTYNASKTGVTDPLSVTANATGEQSPTEYTFTLKHGEQLRFDSIPVGTKYMLTENGSTNYTATVTVTDGKDVDLGNATGLVVGTDKGKNKDVTIGGTSTTTTISKPELGSPIVLTDRSDATTKDNKAVWVNDYADPPTPTGIIMNNFPFIVLILIALAGFTGYIAMKRRSRRDQ